MRAPFVASLIRTGHLDSPVWRAIRFALHKWLRGITPLNRALDLLQGQGYTRMMAVAIATEFDKQCRSRTQFASKTDDSPIYELPDTQSEIPTGNGIRVSLLRRDGAGDSVASAACAEQANGVYVSPLQEYDMQPLRDDTEPDGIPSGAATGALDSIEGTGE